MYDSRTDHKTYGELFGKDCRKGAEHHHVQYAGPKLKRELKRLRSKANRRTVDPMTNMRAYGYGYNNIRSYL